MLLALLPLAPSVSYQAWSVTVEIAFDKSPITPPSGGDWTSLGTPRSFNFTRGKSDKLGDYQAGSCSVEIDNSAFNMDQAYSASALYNHALPGTPMRLRATKGSTTVTLFSGFTLDGFDPQPDGTLGGGSTVARLTDWYGWAATIPLPTSVWAAWVQSTRPEVWWTGDSEAYAVDSHLLPFYNMAQLWNASASSDIVQSGGFGTGQAARDTNFIPNGDGYAMKFFNTAFYTANGSGPTPTSQWGIAFWVKGTNKPGITISGTGSGGNGWSVVVDGLGYLNATVKIAGTTYTAQVAVNHMDGTPHLCMLQVTANVALFLSSDLGTNWPAVATNAVSGGGQLAMNHSATTYVDDFCYWTTGTPSGPTIAQWKAGTGNTYLWNTDTIAQRLANQILATGLPAAAAPTWDFDLANPSYVLAGGYVLPSNLADAVKRMGEVFMGAAYTKRDGTVRVRDSSYTSTNVDDYTTSQAQITDKGTAVAPPIIVRPSARKRTGTRADRIINDITVTLAGSQNAQFSPLRVMDWTSVARYGRRSKTYSSEIVGGGDESTYLTPRMNEIITAYKDPHIELGDLVLRPYGDQACSDFVMQKVELDRRVTYREAMATGTEIINADYRIIGEQWSWSQGLDNWQVTLRLAPV